MLDDPIHVFALVGALGVGSQWLAVRLHMPAIVFMLVAGLLAGPVFGLLDPEASFGSLFGPIVAVAVALILFEGGMTLNFHELRDSVPAIKRLCTIGALLSWALFAAAAHFVAGLSWETSSVFGGILVITGPTVVIPLLRQARLAQRPGSILRWEAIVNDPVGALLAVLAFEVVTALAGAEGGLWGAVSHLALGIVVASAVGLAAGRLLISAFRRGYVPEYMKAPVLVAMVLSVYASTDTVLHESGLLAVTAMGALMANARLPALEELQRFKEHVTVLLVSGVFVLLAAALDPAMLALLDWRAAVFVAVVMLVARPLAVMAVLAGSKVPPKERAFIGWMAPRGVVAVAVSGFFGSRLVDLGVADGSFLAPLAFAIVTATVVVHGFTIRPLARLAGLTSTAMPGVLILGGSRWTVGLARALRALEVPVLIADRNWHRIAPARFAEVPTWYGELLSEAAEHAIDPGRFGYLVAATDNDAYNALVCTDFGPEMGRDKVFQIGRHEESEGARHMPASLGGRTLLASGADFVELERRMQRGWEFKRTRLTPEFGPDDHAAQRHPEAETVALLRGGQILFSAGAGEKLRPKAGDTVIAFQPGRIGGEAADPPLREAAPDREEAGTARSAD